MIFTSQQNVCLNESKSKTRPSACKIAGIIGVYSFFVRGLSKWDSTTTCIAVIEAKLENSIKLFSTATATTAAEKSNAHLTFCQQQAKQKL